MSIFSEYAAYYDLLYKEKDYKKEANEIDKIIKNISPKAKTILNLGCGTGNHDIYLAELGYEVTGVDISEEMINLANDKNDTSFQGAASFLVGDVRNLDLQREFDIVISLFHVVSYQITNEDVCSFFSTAQKHLKNGGLFIFDCWYGPGVLTELPSVRHKILEDDLIKVHRISEPQLFLNNNYVNVKFTIFINKHDHNSFEMFIENHAMRYFFLPEMEYFLSQSNFKIFPNMTSTIFDNGIWNKLFVTRKK